MRNLRRRSERGTSVCTVVKSFCESLSLPVPTRVFKAQQQVHDAIWALASYAWLDASVKTKQMDFTTAQKDWEQKKAVHEKKLPALRRKAID